MTEKSRFWDGTTVGDATESPYDAPTEFSQVMMALAGTLQMDNKGGILPEAANTGLPSSPGANTLRVTAFHALVYGGWYESDASIDTTIPTPSGATRIDRVVVRKDWAAQTIRLARLAGAEGGSAPALTQTAGTTWEVPVAQVSITTGGVMTITDQREFVPLRPTCRVYNSGALTIADATITALTMNSERWDVGTLHSTSVNTSRLTCIVPGYYAIHGSVAWSNSSGAGTIRATYIRMNGTTLLAIQQQPPNGTSLASGQNVSTIQYLNAGDYVELCAFQDRGGTLDVNMVANISPEFGMTRLF